MINRLMQKSIENSFFLFGARGTGKSTWLHHHFSQTDHLYIDLLNPSIEDKFIKSPNELLFMIEGLANQSGWVVIDEIQKAPKLLDVVHLCIEKFHTKFALTGSSARKLKRGAANLLAGRAFVFNLFPLTHIELGPRFDLNHTLNWGSLPQLYTYTTDQSKLRYLRAYGHTYLKEEIAAEQLVRKLTPFRQFLEIAAQSNGEIINYSNIARDVGVDTVTVQSYFQILEDTLIGYFLHPYHTSIRKKQRTNPKFYFFDTGVKRSLENTLTLPLRENTYAYGKAFEHFLITEITRLSHYFETDFKLSYLKTRDQAEIDLIVERPGQPTMLIEIKSSTHVDDRDVRSLVRFLPDFNSAEGLLLSNDPTRKVINGVLALHWKAGIQHLFENR